MSKTDELKKEITDLENKIAKDVSLFIEKNGCCDVDVNIKSTFHHGPTEEIKFKGCKVKIQITI